jgi:hypothetical protein
MNVVLGSFVTRARYYERVASKLKRIATQGSPFVLIGITEASGFAKLDPNSRIGRGVGRRALPFTPPSID